MKKKLISLLLVLVMPMLVLYGCSCSIETTPYNTIEKCGRFVIIKEYTSMSTVYVEMYDKNTKVMYVYVDLGESGSLQVLLNADGSPMLYEGEL